MGDGPLIGLRADIPLIGRELGGGIEKGLGALAELVEGKAAVTVG